MTDNMDITSNEQFQRKFHRANLIWMVILILYTSIFVIAVFSGNASYLHDWRGPAIITLALSIIGIYLYRILVHDDEWPPRFVPALCMFLGMYLAVIALSTIDNTFSYILYSIFGISFSLFSPRRVIFFVCVITVTLFAYQGLLTWPISGGQILGIVGEGIALFSMTFISILTQNLICERYERNRLVQQLTETNRELEEAHNQLAASAQQEQELAVLRERTRLARDMHDTLGHALVLVSVKLEAAQRLRERDPERCIHELESTKEIVRESMKELRASIANLRSPSLERESVCRVLSRYAHEMAQRADLRVTYDLQANIEGLPDQIEETLWKVGQEALTNIEKHAQAHHVTLHISRATGFILMRIADDGIGLHLATQNGELCPPKVQNASESRPASPEGHYGLCGMYERIESIGGQLTLSSTPNTGGTTIEVQLPLIVEPAAHSEKAPDAREVSTTAGIY